MVDNSYSFRVSKMTSYNQLKICMSVTYIYDFSSVISMIIIYLNCVVMMMHQEVEDYGLVVLVTYNSIKFAK
jgi:hypothetical protein